MKNTTLNIMKGLCMLLVVAGHTNCPFKNFIYLFHVPVFFMISGYLFKNDYSLNHQNLCTLFKKRLCSLWIPYVVSNILLLLVSSITAAAGPLSFDINNLLIEVLKITFFCFEPTLGGASWFIGTLFFVTLIFAFSNYLTRNWNTKYQLLFQSFLSFSFIALSFHAEIKLVLARVLTIYILFFGGYFIKSQHICADWRRAFFLGFVGLIILILTQRIEVDIASITYPNPLILVILSFSGWYFIYSVALLFEKNSISSYLLAYIGSHTLIILLLHFTVFSMINYIYPECPWWLKTILGVIIPLCIPAASKRLDYAPKKTDKSIIS